MSKLSDVGAERAVLAGIFQYGNDGYIEVSDIIDSKTFTIESNKFIYQCIEHAIKHNPQLDIPVFLSAANDLGLSEFFREKVEIEYLRSLTNFPIELANIRGQAKKIMKLMIARGYQSKLKQASNSLGDITGNETISEITSLAEKPIFEFSRDFGGDDDRPKLIGENIDDYVDYLKNNPNRQVGIPSPWYKFNRAVGGGFRRKTVSLIATRSGVGKALKNNELVYTPYGPKTIDNIQLGDTVCCPSGKTAKVIGVFPQGERDIYSIKFRYGEEVLCSAEHLWQIHGYKRKCTEILDAKSMSKLIYRLKNGRHRFFIHQSDCYYEPKPVPMDAYIVGVLLGDGSIGKIASYCSFDTEIVNKVNSKLTDGYTSVERKRKNHFTIKNKNCTAGRPNKYKNILEEVGILGHLSYSKFIPDIYKYNSKEIRIELIRGLMDTDGYVPKKGGRLEFSTVSEQLAKDFKEVVNSLGCLAHIVSKKSRYTQKDGTKSKYFHSYVVLVNGNNLSNLVSLTRKKAKLVDQNKKIIKNYIESVRLVQKAKCTCISIDSKDGLFLTTNHVTTHNSSIGDNVAIYECEKIGIPVLMLDTEMSEEEHQDRLLANLSRVNISEIAEGRFVGNKYKEERIVNAAQRIKKMPYTYKSIAGKNFDEVLSIIRRWIYQDVGFENGRTKDCLVIYDYFKLMDSDQLGDMQEFQAIGFQISDMHNFCVEYDVPVLSFVQLNRDGIDKELSSSISQSDRLVWLATTVAIFKEKSEEEITEDGELEGNRKMILVKCRHGKGLDSGNYINMHMQGEFCSIIELRTKAEVRYQGSNSGFEVNDDESTENQSS